jgi:hypothetical protein
MLHFYPYLRVFLMIFINVLTLRHKKTDHSGMAFDSHFAQAQWPSDSGAHR